MLLPDARWEWLVDPTNQALKVKLQDGSVFHTAYCCDDLHTVPNNAFFSIEQSRHFCLIVDALVESEVPFEQSDLLTIGLNGVVVLNFHKPVVNKSWLYKKQDACLFAYNPQLAWFNVDNKEHLALTLEMEGDTILCLNLSDEFVTSDNKKHKQFSVMRILSDRLLNLNGLTVNER